MKVWPKNDDMRKLLKHPSGSVGFHAEGPAEWPDDSFTHRRIADGDVTKEEPKVERASEEESADQRAEIESSGETATTTPTSAKERSNRK